MSNPRCVFNAASALRGVFLAPIEHPPTQFLRCPHFSPIQRRTVFKATSNAVPEQRLPRDDDITAPFLRLKNAEQRLEPPRSTAEILKRVNRKTHMLQIITMGKEGEVPIARIVDKKEAHLQKKQKKGKNPASVVKTIEMNWAIEKNDLGHRLGKMRDFLEKGNKVEVLLAGRKKGRKATIEEAEEVVRRIREFVEEIEGAKEGRKMEGKIGVQAILCFEGRVAPTAKKEAGKKDVEKQASLEQEGEDRDMSGL
ncbi:hypothetical protein EYC84_008445 [Monilinia fructicola]|uniref:Translation initiation factor 3 C-terminal domain-containing protein n=1 Tax=Monilinia fructicola TaxID=38448 RepID=A0A5M9JFC9_MONFR|nr:hypothetical protein EYC84_008445 [Monilinia fructicola]